MGQNDDEGPTRSGDASAHSDPAPTQRPKRSARMAQGSAASLGLELGLAIGVGAIGGHYLETHVTHWAPWTSLLGLALGIGAATRAILRTVRDFRATLSDDDDDASKPDRVR